MTNSEIENFLEHQLEEKFSIVRNVDYEDDSNLFDSHIDSFGFLEVLEILQEINQRFGISLKAEVLLTESKLSFRGFCQKVLESQ